MTISTESLFDHRGVYAVPPVARNDDGRRSVNPDENVRIVRHIASGGVRRLLYGGNGNLYHITLDDYGVLLACLEGASDGLVIVPSVGPAYGRAIEQAVVLRRHRFPFAMLLPGGHPRNAAGLERGYREIADAAGIPLLLYLKAENNFGDDIEAGLDVIGRLVADGIAVGIKYAIVRENPREDAYLGALLDRVDRKFVISGLGEPPVVVHMEDWKLPGFTTGSGCLNPGRAKALFDAAVRGDFDTARMHQAHFMPLEELRERWGAVVVLHEAVALAEIAQTGPHVPFLAGLTHEQRDRVAGAAKHVASQSD